METILAAPLGAIADTAGVCDSVFSIPGAALASAGLAALAGGIYDRNV